MKTIDQHDVSYALGIELTPSEAGKVALLLREMYALRCKIELLEEEKKNEQGK